MAEADDSKREIITNPARYLDSQKETLKERLRFIQLSETEENKITQRLTQRLIRDKVLGLFKVGELVNVLLNWNELVEQARNSAKRDVLLEMYFAKSEANEFAVQQLRNFISDPQGNTLFNKILRILDDSPPDPELMGHLGSALKFMAQSKFRDLFAEHKYALSQIEQISPQGLTILADGKMWPQFQLGSFNAVGSKVTSDYVDEFAGTYAVQGNS